LFVFGLLLLLLLLLLLRGSEACLAANWSGELESAIKVAYWRTLPSPPSAVSDMWRSESALLVLVQNETGQRRAGFWAT